ncbi:MAG: GTP 3',8-cyclase MoaA, partial [Actinobacteria bacterium]
MAIDTLGRPLHDLRISVTDRCNFRCTYCMPKTVFNHEYRFLPRSDLLTFEELERLTVILAGMGVAKVRITGGEPLLRHGIDELVGRLSAVVGIDDLALTTNGSLLERKAAALAAAGLRRVTVSLDSIDDATFRAMNDVDFAVDRVLDGIRAAADAGLSPVKINAVVKRGVNDGSVEQLAEHFRGTGHVVRFIEYMDVGTANGWALGEVVPAKEIIARISARWPLEPVGAGHRGEVAARYQYRDGAGEIGVIASVSTPFCGDCTRLRLSAEGRLYTCLFAYQGFDVRSLLRGGASDDELRSELTALWEARTDRYSELR